MKKIFIVFLMYTIGLFYVHYNVSKSAFLEVKQNNIGKYYVFVDKINLTSRNIKTYFNEEKILLVFPNNEFTSDKRILNDMYKIPIRNIEDIYIKNLQKFLLTDNVDNVYRNGILINKLLIRCSIREIKLMKKSNPAIKYSQSLEGKYM